MTMHWIASQAVTSATQVTFSGIPQNFTHLQLRVSSRGTNTSVNENLLIGFNGDFTAGRYSYGHIFYSNGSTATGTYMSNAAGYHYSCFQPAASGLANVFGSAIIDILGYSGSTKFKPIRGFGGHDQNGSGYVGQWSGQFTSTSPITSVTFASTGAPYTLAVGTRLDLYGITSNPIATGL